MIDIQIDEKRKLISDDKDNFIIAVRYKKEDGSFGYNGKRFYASFEHAIHELVEGDLLKSEATSIKELAEDLKKIKDKLIKVFEKK